MLPVIGQGTQVARWAGRGSQRLLNIGSEAAVRKAMREAAERVAKLLRKN